MLFLKLLKKKYRNTWYDLRDVLYKLRSLCYLFLLLAACSFSDLGLEEFLLTRAFVPHQRYQVELANYNKDSTRGIPEYKFTDWRGQRQSCCFAHLNLLFFWRSRWRRRCLSSLMGWLLSMSTKGTVNNIITDAEKGFKFVLVGVFLLSLMPQTDITCWSSIVDADSWIILV